MTKCLVVDAPIPLRLSLRVNAFSPLPSSFPTYGAPCLYLLASSLDENLVKVGRTNDLQNRRYGRAYVVKGMVCLAYVLVNQDYRGIVTLERELLAKFRARFDPAWQSKKHGKLVEWFQASDLEAYSLFADYCTSLLAVRPD